MNVVEFTNGAGIPIWRMQEELVHMMERIGIHIILSERETS